jgi:hypothetical protein
LHTVNGNIGGLRDIACVDNNRLISADNLGHVHVWTATTAKPDFWILPAVESAFYRQPRRQGSRNPFFDVRRGTRAQ